MVANHRKLNKYEQMPSQHILKPIIFRVLSASHRKRTLMSHGGGTTHEVKRFSEVKVPK